MHIELIEALRCPSPHAFTWLVAQTATMRDRDIETGMVGCPECGRRFPIAEGVLDLRLDRAPSPAAEDVPTFGEEALTRLAALLGMETRGGIVLLAGRYAMAAPALASVIDGVHLLALDPFAPLESGHGVSIALSAGRLPLRDGAARAIALDPAHASDTATLESAVAVLAARGRMVAPASVPLPGDLRELARDEREWVAERVPAPAVVPLRRG